VKSTFPVFFIAFTAATKREAEKAGGCGLGLAIVKHIAQAHSGHVGMQSKIGGGSIFTITLNGS